MVQQYVSWWEKKYDPELFQSCYAIKMHRIDCGMKSCDSEKIVRTIKLPTKLLLLGYMSIDGNTDKYKGDI